MFSKLTSFTKKVADLANKPAIGGVALKAHFDAAVDELRQYFNNLIDGLKSTQSGDSGAKNIGASSIPGLEGNDIQALLESLKTYSDGKFRYIVEQGSNSNGEYVKYSDGILECWKVEQYKPTSVGAWASVSVAGNSYWYIPGNWTYPVPFKVGSEVTCRMNGDVGGVTAPETHNAWHIDHTKCGTESGVFGANAQGKDLIRQMYAIGKWK